jgi:hypothetical protein
MAENMNWVGDTAPYGRPSRRMQEVTEFEERMNAVIALDGVLALALARRAQNPPTWFMPDGTIRLLPEDCRINLAATTDTDPTCCLDFDLEPFEEELPLWNPLPMRTRLVGKVRASFTPDQYRNPGRVIEEVGQAQHSVLLVVDPPTPTAGRDVYLLPKAVAPYFDLVTEGEIVIDIHDVEMNEDADTEIKRLEIIVTLLEEWDTAFSLQMSTFAIKARRWRVERREWEFETVQAIFVTRNLHMLSPDFDPSSLVFARYFVSKQNELDRAGGVAVWEGVWDKEGLDALVACRNQVFMTGLQVKRILFDLFTDDELRQERNRLLVADMRRYWWVFDDD